MVDVLYLIYEFGGIENLKGKKVVMIWVYLLFYGKLLFVF